MYSLHEELSDDWVLKQKLHHMRHSIPLEMKQHLSSFKNYTQIKNLIILIENKYVEFSNNLINCYFVKQSEQMQRISVKIRRIQQMMVKFNETQKVNKQKIQKFSTPPKKFQQKVAETAKTQPSPDFKVKSPSLIVKVNSESDYFGNEFCKIKEEVNKLRTFIVQKHYHENFKCDSEHRDYIPSQIRDSGLKISEFSQNNDEIYRSILREYEKKDEANQQSLHAYRKVFGDVLRGFRQIRQTLREALPCQHCHLKFILAQYFNNNTLNDPTLIPPLDSHILPEGQDGESFGSELSLLQ